MKRLLVLGAALLGLSGCVSEYPVYDDYPVYEPRPRIYDPRPVIVYEDRYRPRPVYRDRDPYWRDDRRYGRYDRPRYREDPRPYYGRPGYDRPGYDRPRRDYDRPERVGYDRPGRPPRVAPPAYDPRNNPGPAGPALVRPAPGAQPEINAGRAFGGRALPAPGSGPRPYIPPQPAD
ncbi:hypothetical protein [Aureimonas sp. Leaf324]|uniref:hypothetical protein n=1 Tax=Aureimonas sp. Leaf324 TaxID=1736336 RepID=UPI000AE50D3C|nr:hypothetical protein [Aureimonas sp. Leaf324]